MVLRHRRSLAHDAVRKLISAHAHDGTLMYFDVLYSALGLQVNSTLARTLGARCDSDGQVIVDPHLQTSVDGVYA